MSLVYKLLTAGEWDSAMAAGRFEGSKLDREDGYIHLSGAAQAQETARLHFHGQKDLVLVTLETDTLGPGLKWEASRAGALFPHLYGPLDVALALEVRPLSLGADGAPELGL
jgi:uncharacterized protein (DUF952 family)